MFCSSRTSNRPQREKAAGISFFAVHPPFAYWKKFEQAETLVSMFATSKPGRLPASIVGTDASVAVPCAASLDRLATAKTDNKTAATAIIVKSLRMIRVLQIKIAEESRGNKTGVLSRFLHGPVGECHHRSGDAFDLL